MYCCLFIVILENISETFTENKWFSPQMEATSVRYQKSNGCQICIPHPLFTLLI